MSDSPSPDPLSGAQEPSHLVAIQSSNNKKLEAPSSLFTVANSAAWGATPKEHDECGVDSFVCASGGCVVSEKRCNGIADCSDKSDEKDCSKAIHELKPDHTYAGSKHSTGSKLCETGGTGAVLCRSRRSSGRYARRAPKSCTGSGSCSGSHSGSGNRSCRGTGSCSGSGSGIGTESCSGTGSCSGTNNGSGTDSCRGDGSCSGSGSGSGIGSCSTTGSCSGVSSGNGRDSCRGINSCSGAQSGRGIDSCSGTGSCSGLGSGRIDGSCSEVGSCSASEY